MQRGLLDTSILILFERIADKSGFPEYPLISAITLAELTVGPLIATDETVRTVRLRHLQQAEADFDPLPFDARAARAFGLVSSSLHRAGRKAKARTYDAMIAAVAIANDLPLFTCNPSDYEGIDGLEVVAVPHPDSEEPPQ